MCCLQVEVATTVVVVVVGTEEVGVVEVAMEEEVVATVVVVAEVSRGGAADFGFPAQHILCNAASQPAEVDMYQQQTQFHSGSRMVAAAAATHGRGQRGLSRQLFLGAYCSPPWQAMVVWVDLAVHMYY